MQMMIQLLAAEGAGDRLGLVLGIGGVVVGIGIVLLIFYIIAVREKKRTGRLEVVVAEMGL